MTVPSTRKQVIFYTTIQQADYNPDCLKLHKVFLAGGLKVGDRVRVTVKRLPKEQPMSDSRTRRAR